MLFTRDRQIAGMQNPCSAAAPAPPVQTSLLWTPSTLGVLPTLQPHNRQEVLQWTLGARTAAVGGGSAFPADLSCRILSMACAAAVHAKPSKLFGGNSPQRACLAVFHPNGGGSQRGGRPNVSGAGSAATGRAPVLSLLLRWRCARLESNVILPCPKRPMAPSMGPSLPPALPEDGLQHPAPLQVPVNRGSGPRRAAGVRAMAVPHGSGGLTRRRCVGWSVGPKHTPLLHPCLHICGLLGCAPCLPTAPVLPIHVTRAGLLQQAA